MVSALTRIGPNPTWHRLFEGRWNPLRVHGTRLPPTWLAVAKGLAFLLIALDYQEFIGDIFLPHVPLLGHLPAKAWSVSLAAALVVGLLLLFSNLAVRLGSAMVGTVFLADLLANRVAYRNAVVWVGIVLVLIALYDDHRSLVTMRAQFGLLYIGAALSKLFDTDWHDGTFMGDWRFDDAALYDTLASAVGEPVLATGASWGVIVGEVVLAGLLTRARTARVGVLGAAGFHTVPVVVNGLTFGIFYPALALSLITLLETPAAPTDPRDRRFWHHPGIALVVVVAYGAARAAKRSVL